MLRQVHYDQYNKDYGEKGKGSLEWEDSQDKMNHCEDFSLIKNISIIVVCQSAQKSLKSVKLMTLFFTVNETLVNQHS